MRHTAYSENIKLAHPAKRRAQTRAILIILGDDLNFALVIYWPASCLEKAARAHKECPAHRLSKIVQFVVQIFGERTALALTHSGDAGGNRLWFRRRILRVSGASRKDRGGRG
jgi:hypothetical protein